MAKAATVSRRFGRPSPVRVYWLARCEGFRLRCRDGTSGVVEEVLLDPSKTEAEALVVRVGRVVPRLVVVPAERVDTVAPFEEVLSGAGLEPASRTVRVTAADSVLGRSLRTAVAVLWWIARFVWSAARWTLAACRRAAPHLLAAARATLVRVRLGAAGAALLTSALTQWLALRARDLALRLSNDGRPR